ncbi:MAG: hypothetical protein O2960_08565 [Verrucomicrobia bacterium]|nr:hypothetical protein [Verrucomicrobiota bacterium]
MEIPDSLFRKVKNGDAEECRRQAAPAAKEKGEAEFDQVRTMVCSLRRSGWIAKTSLNHCATALKYCC